MYEQRIRNREKLGVKTLSSSMTDHILWISSSLSLSLVYYHTFVSIFCMYSETTYPSPITQMAHDIIFFGETTEGKCSCINLLAGQPISGVSPGI